MFKNTYQSGLLSIFYSCGSNPLAIWETEVHNGHIKRLTDKEVNSIVLEIVSVNVATTFMTCPRTDEVLGIRLPFLVMIVKNLKRYFSFEITVLDDKNMRRRFRVSNFQSTTKIKPFCTTMPIGLSGGWNQIQFNLADFTRRAYGTQFIETLRVQVHANARLRRIYFSDRLYSEEELPQEYKLYMPLEHKSKKADKKETLVKPEAEKPAQKVEKAETAPPAVIVEAVSEVVAEAATGTPAENVPVEAAATQASGEVTPQEPPTAGPENEGDEQPQDNAEQVADEEKQESEVPTPAEEAEATETAPEVVETPEAPPETEPQEE